eukprot:superscaffoldBa00000072_g1118
MTNVGVVVFHYGGRCIDQPIAIITPYREPMQGRIQSRFNQYHTKAHNIHEWAFSMKKDTVVGDPREAVVTLLGARADSFLYKPHRLLTDGRGLWMDGAEVPFEY